jgi:hypothetical protein
MSWLIPFKVIQLVADLKFDGHPNAIFPIYMHTFMIAEVQLLLNK